MTYVHYCLSRTFKGSHRYSTLNTWHLIVNCQMGNILGPWQMQCTSRIWQLDRVFCVPSAEFTFLVFVHTLNVLNSTSGRSYLLNYTLGIEKRISFVLKYHNPLSLSHVRSVDCCHVVTKGSWEFSCRSPLFFRSIFLFPILYIFFVWCFMKKSGCLAYWSTDKLDGRPVAGVKRTSLIFHIVICPWSVVLAECHAGCTSGKS